MPIDVGRTRLPPAAGTESVNSRAEQVARRRDLPREHFADHRHGDVAAGVDLVEFAPAPDRNAERAEDTRA